MDCLVGVLGAAGNPGRFLGFVSFEEGLLLAKERTWGSRPRPRKEGYHAKPHDLHPAVFHPHPSQPIRLSQPEQPLGSILACLFMGCDRSPSQLESQAPLAVSDSSRADMTPTLSEAASTRARGQKGAKACVIPRSRTQAISTSSHRTIWPFTRGSNPHLGNHVPQDGRPRGQHHPVSVEVAPGHQQLAVDPPL